ncbi:NHLP-related RiPP peptide [Lysobacter fragariae]
MANKIQSAPLSPEVADRLLDLLSTDDAYRARFQADPGSALYEVGYQKPAPAQMTACGTMPVAMPEALIDCKVQNLASKEVISAARAEIRAMLTKGLAQSSPSLDAAITAERRSLK